MTVPGAEGAGAPLIAFVHVPKTAGSMVNHVLARLDLPGQDHVESWLADPAARVEALAGLSWVSGHVPRPALAGLLSGMTARRLRFFSVVRDPVEQIRSHYNWLIEIFHRGEPFYGNHPDIIKTISESIRGTDNTDPEQIRAQILRWPGLFLNQQARVVFGEDGIRLDGPAMAARLRSDYEFVAREEGLAELIRRITGQEAPELPRVNDSRSHFDPAVFRTPGMIEFLQTRHAADFRLYAAVAALAA